VFPLQSKANITKVVVHMRKNPAKWAVYTSPLWFLIAGTICTLSIVYKGSPKLGLNKKPPGYIAGVTLGTGGGVALLAAIFFVPYIYVTIIKKDPTVRWFDFIQGPLLFKRPVVESADEARVPNYHVVQDEDETSSKSLSGDSEKGSDISPVMTDEKNRTVAEVAHVQKTHKELIAEGDAKLNAKLCEKRGPMGWAMRTLRDNPMGL